MSRLLPTTARRVLVPWDTSRKSHVVTKAHNNSRNYSNFGLGNNWLVGDVFMKNVYTAFRYDPKSVGFAKLA